MRLGLIGRGQWANVYARTLRSMEIEFWQTGREWRDGKLPFEPDGIIVATSAETHFRIALELIDIGFPCIIEKPICMKYDHARQLLDFAKFHDDAIVFTGHTRLYSNAWRAFKAKALAEGVHSAYASAGGPCKLTPLWDWGPHLVAMCLDLNFDPLKAHILTDSVEEPLRVIVNGNMEFRDVDEKPMPLEVLLTEFISAIDRGEPDLSGLELGVSVIEALEALDERRRMLCFGVANEGRHIWH